MERSRNDSIEDLKKVPGIGYSIAEQIIDKFEINSIEDLKELEASKLSEIRGLSMKKSLAVLEFSRSMDSKDSVRCEQCDRYVGFAESISGMRDSYFCSAECKDIWERRRANSLFEDYDESHSEDPRLCSFCSKEIGDINIESDGDVFCSKLCIERWKFQEEKVNVKCDYCGKEFSRLRTLAKLRDHHFCTFKCKDLWETGEDMLFLNCEYCGKEFTRKKALVSKTGHQFCSLDCKKNWRDRDDLITVKCEFCGEKFKRKRILIHRSEKQFCSYRCKNYWDDEDLLLKCDICGKGFRRKRKFIIGDEPKYCSYSCKCVGE